MSHVDPNKIPYNKQEELLDRFCEAVCRLKSKALVKDFLKDLLNRHERLMLVRRFLIAELLDDGWSYRDIQEKMKASPNTIAKVDRWLNFGRNGYLTAIRSKLDTK